MGKERGREKLPVISEMTVEPFYLGQVFKKDTFISGIKGAPLTLLDGRKPQFSSYIITGGQVSGGLAYRGQASVVEPSYSGRLLTVTYRPEAGEALMPDSVELTDLVNRGGYMALFEEIGVGGSQGYNMRFFSRGTLTAESEPIVNLMTLLASDVKQDPDKIEEAMYAAGIRFADTKLPSSGFRPEALVSQLTNLPTAKIFIKKR